MMRRDWDFLKLLKWVFNIFNMPGVSGENWKSTIESGGSNFEPQKHFLETPTFHINFTFFLQISISPSFLGFSDSSNFYFRNNTRNTRVMYMAKHLAPIPTSLLWLNVFKDTCLVMVKQNRSFRFLKRGTEIFEIFEKWPCMPPW